MIIVFAQIGLFTAKSMGTKKNRFPYGLAIFFLLSQSKKKQPNRKQKQEKQDVVKDLLRFMFSLSHINYLNMPMMGH